ncbi:MAG: DUF1987 domain-containing protein [Flavobacteriales bacterium]|nr:DUF1987 domain-containing protein [Flavobacteriales bacterium]
MSDIDTEGTLQSPTISFDETNNYLLIEGRSTLENPAKFYQPLISKLENCKKLPARKMEIDFKLEYFNTTSSISILGVLKCLQSIRTDGNEVVINWFYDAEDEDILEIGEDFSTIVKFPFNLIVNSN